MQVLFTHRSKFFIAWELFENKVNREHSTADPINQVPFFRELWHIGPEDLRYIGIQEMNVDLVWGKRLDFVQIVCCF